MVESKIVEKHIGGGLMYRELNSMGSVGILRREVIKEV